MCELAVPDVYRITPQRRPDGRGCFYESYRHDLLAEAIGHPVSLLQVNYSQSRRGTIRGVHSARVPPGQAKYVTCVSGEALDIAVDLRVGSPTFGRHVATRLSSENGIAVYLPEGIGHAFQALSDLACMSYLCSTLYDAETVVEVNLLDPELALPWDPSHEPIMSDKDSNAPSLAEAQATGQLPSYRECAAYYDSLRTASQEPCDVH